MELTHHDVISTSVYNFYKQCRLSKFAWMREEKNVDSADDESDTMEEVKNSPELIKSTRSSTLEQPPGDTSSSEESIEEDEDYQISRDANSTRRKRSRSTPAPFVEPTPGEIVPVGSAEAPAILTSNGRNTKTCEFCNTSDTPMWRRGPSGKGTLCNACGVKWSLSNRKRNTKGRADSTGSNGASVVKRISPDRGNGGESKSTGKARRTHRPHRADGRSRDSDFTESSEEEYKEDNTYSINNINQEANNSTNNREYYCGYCNTSWPQAHFKNIQQFGAHCSNCSRKHPKDVHVVEEIGQKRKFESEEMMDNNVNHDNNNTTSTSMNISNEPVVDDHSGDLGSLITAVEDQIMAEEAAKTFVDEGNVNNNNNNNMNHNIKNELMA